MIVGIPREIKNNENRIAMTPSGVAQLVQRGHTVLVEENAGLGSQFSNADYATAGAQLADVETVWSRADMIVKVKEPLPAEYRYLRPDLILFTYLHLAADATLTRAVVDSGVTGIAYETVELPDGSLPLLTPMSEVAGRMSVQAGAHFLEKHAGGRGILLGGVPGVRPANVLIIGGGVAGTHAAQMALGMGANVTLMDINLDRLRELDETLHGRFQTVASNPYNIAEAVKEADLVIGAVLIKGAKAPKLVTRAMIATMRPGSVLVDIAVDQGGCIETTHPTTHAEPVFEVEGVLHYCVANMPGAVPRTSTFALSNATLPYVLQLADKGFEAAVADSPALEKGVNTYAGKLTYAAVADAFDMPFVALEELMHTPTAVFGD